MAELAGPGRAPAPCIGPCDSADVVEVAAAGDDLRQLGE